MIFLRFKTVKVWYFSGSKSQTRSFLNKCLSATEVLHWSCQLCFVHFFMYKVIYVNLTRGRWNFVSHIIFFVLFQGRGYARAMLLQRQGSQITRTSHVGGGVSTTLMGNTAGELYHLNGSKAGSELELTVIDVGNYNNGNTNNLSNVWREKISMNNHRSGLSTAGLTGYT